MEFPSYIPKSEIFYNTDWSRDSELYFVSAIGDEARGGQFVWPDHIDDAINRVISGLYARCGISVSYTLCMQRLRLLHGRLQMFHYIINTPKVKWFRDDNTLSTPFGFWSMLLKVNPISQAYVEEGEHLYDQLLEIFGAPPGSPCNPPICLFPLEELGIACNLISTDMNASTVGPKSLVKINAPTFATARNAKVGTHNPKASRSMLPPAPVAPRTLFSPGPSESSASANSPSLPINPPVKRLFRD